MKNDSIQSSWTATYRINPGSAKSSSVSTEYESPPPSRVKALQEAVAATGSSAREVASTPVSEVGPLSTARIYPHLYDQSAIAGQVMVLLGRATKDVGLAIDAFDKADLRTVGTYMTAVTAIASDAQSKADFNRSFRAVLGYIRRATLVANSIYLDRPALNAMLNALNQLSNKPTIDLAGAAELTEMLSRQGWHGEHHQVEALVGVLLNHSNSDSTTQSDLFASNSPLPQEAST